MSSKISTLESVTANARAVQQSGGTVVFTNGCYDIVHPGHVDLLYRARGLGDALVVAINSDDSVRRLKGEKRPIFSEQERAELLAGMEMVDFVCTFSEDTPLETILRIRPDVLVKGDDWGMGEIVGRTEVEHWGGRVLGLPILKGCSTTAIIERILSRYCTR
jgi:rfaE bifunctional protein nucleotidyltransferase chain/domain